MTDFINYYSLQRKGVPPHDVYLAAKANGVDHIRCIRLLREVFKLSLIEAKEVIVQADKLGTSLSTYQSRFAPGLEQALEDEQPSQE